MTLEDKIGSFVILGKFFSQFRTASFREDGDLKRLNDHFAVSFGEMIQGEQAYNPWFTPENVRLSLATWADALEEKKIREWLSGYAIPDKGITLEKEIGVIMAGNIPLVGFHDFICVLFSGCRIVAKLPVKDDRLLPAIHDILIFLNREFEDLARFEKGPLKDPGAVIATGSNNSARYFDYYFGKYPHIIRKNRNSVAVLTGTESKYDLEHLAFDIFSYFGLGCRNVSKIFIPGDYEIPHLLDRFHHYAYLGNHHKYANNYEYQRAVHLVNVDPFYDTGFLVVKEDRSYASPVGTLYYERYADFGDLNQKLSQDSGMLQCIVGSGSGDRLDFGQTQRPMLPDYADNVDTLKFLLNLSSN